MGFQKLEEIFSLQTKEISFVTKLGVFGGKLISTQKNKREGKSGKIVFIILRKIVQILQVLLC